ncbi:MAG: hypothetical protein AB7V25_15685 [Mangrovibacterium sp.]
MRHLILTSSIFFILGLKMTNTIEPNPKMATDTLHITVPEAREVPAVNEQKTAAEEKAGKGKEVIPGSGKLTAPRPAQSADKAE